MGDYWLRHRLLPSSIMVAVVAIVTGLLFAFPYIERRADSYNSQSVYRNSDIDFIAPEPSFDQVSDLPGTEGIDKVFPFYLTKTDVKVNGASRTTTVLLSDHFENVDMTMYNEKRLIKEKNESVSNPVYVDWQFSRDTSAEIGDTLTMTLGGSPVEFTVAAIYETNSVYDGGAILAEISTAQKNAIAENSKSNGYSAVYISSSDYNACRSYLTTEYRPLGRLRDRSQFDSDAQYHIHYDAIMSSGYANEITDFRVREDSLDTEQSPLSVIIGAIVAAVAAIAFNFMISQRGSEKGYFTKFCIPKGQNVKPYYNISLCFEIVFFLIVYVGSLFLRVKMSSEYLPRNAFGAILAVIPAAYIVGEIIAFAMNNTMVADITTEVLKEQEKKAKAEAETRDTGNIDTSTTGNIDTSTDERQDMG